jgi:hypothetical protein
MKIVIIICSLISIVFQSSACDICGCSARENALGVLPQIQKNFIGTSYQYRSFTSTHLSDDTSEDIVTGISKEKYHTLSFTGMYSPISKLRITAQIPFNFYNKYEYGSSIYSRGIGDITLLVLGEIYSTKKCKANGIKHLLMAGIGTKFPTGSINKKYGIAIVEQNMQTGTGSFDFPFLAYYALKTKKSGIRSELQYLINTENKNDFKYGNRFSGNLQTWYWYEKNKWNVIPYVGTQLDWSGKDKNRGEINDYSGGYVLNGMIGADIFIQNFGWGVSVKTPFYQNIGMGHIDNKIKCNFQFIYLIQKNKKS